MPTVEDDRFVVVVNDELQYSIWPHGRDLPGGWRADGCAGSRAECLAHIARVWTDMRPLSVRRHREVTRMTPLPAQPVWIDELFRTIDSASWKDFARFFHADIVYERPGYPPIEGIEALLHFYSFTRIIAEGRHSLDGRLHGDGKAICWGQFSGRAKNGDLLNERFADAYELEDGVIKRRITYFFRAAI